MEATGVADRIAVLIDADNISHRLAEALLDEIAKYGNPTIKRAYADWSSPRVSGWRDEMNARAIRGMHQGAFTRGKNSTDSALIIDAMDLLYDGNVEAFALVTSDSDFTSLALRLRESGKVVYGLGGAKTPASLQNACDRFIRLELLGESEPATVSRTDTADDTETEIETVSRPAEPTTPEQAAAPEINLQSALTKAVNAVAGEDGWASPGPVGKHLSRTHPSLDPRNYGVRGLESLLREQPYLEVATSGNQTTVRVKGQGKPQKAGTTKTATKTATKTPAKTPAKAASKAASKTAAKAATKTTAKAAEEAPVEAPAKAPAKKAATPKVTQTQKY